MQGPEQGRLASWELSLGLKGAFKRLFSLISEKEKLDSHSPKGTLVLCPGVLLSAFNMQLFLDEVIE